MEPLTLFFLAIALIMAFFLLKSVVSDPNGQHQDEEVIDEDLEGSEVQKQYNDFLTDEPLGPETQIIEVPAPDGKVRAEVNKKTAARFAKYGLKAFPGFKARLEASRNGTYTKNYYRVSLPDSYDLLDFFWDYYFFTQILGLFNDSTFDYVPMDDPEYGGYIDKDYVDPKLEEGPEENNDDAGTPDDVVVDSETNPDVDDSSSDDFGSDDFGGGDFGGDF